MSQASNIRHVQLDDIDRVVDLIRESTQGKTLISSQQLVDDLFQHPLTLKRPNADTNVPDTNRPILSMLVAEVTTSEKLTKIVGYLSYYYHYTPWVGLSITLADIFVVPNYRRQGIARLMFHKINAQTIKEGLKQIQFNLEAARCPQYVIDTVKADPTCFVDRDEESNWSIFRLFV